MILPISPGRWQDRFGGGREGTPNQPPLVDLIVPKNKSRPRSSRTSTVARGGPAVLPGVVPAEQK